MAEKNNKTKTQRDQFLAFSFASADLFIEVSEEGKVSFALGAAKGMTGVDETELIGKNWLDLFSSYDQAALIDMLETSKLAKRCGPMLVDMNESIAKRKAVLSGIKMPGSNNFYITLGLSNKMMSKLAAAPPQQNGDLSEVSDFLDEAEEVFDFGRSVGIDPDVTLFDFGFTDSIIEEEFGDENWGKFQEDVANFLQSQSLNGSNPGKLSDSKFALTHDPDIDPEYLIDEITKIAEEYMPEDKKWPPPTSVTVHADLEGVSEWEAEKALSYIVTDFKASEDTAATITKMKDIGNFSQGVKKRATENLDRAKELKSIIERVDFSIRFIPVLNLEENDVAYYEIIPHFNTGEARDWLMLAEDTKQSTAFDLAYCERIINHIAYKEGGSRRNFVFKLSSQSVQTPGFYNKLNEQLNKGENLESRLLFEIPYTNDAESLKITAALTTRLAKEGYRVVMGDFAGNNAALSQSKSLGIKQVKISKKSTRNIEKYPRKKASLENMIKRCQKQGIAVVADSAENQKQLNELKSIGVSFAQGNIFGKPQTTPNFTPI
jgi:EAL domain-containing protein (putative c-di-GMP-specific phosphodiesterase class I)